MKKGLLRSIFVALIFCIFSPADNAHAALITIGIEAVVDYVNDPDNLLEGKVNIGDIIIGSYAYDTSTPDTNPASDVGEYLHFSPPCGVLFMVGGFTFMSDPNNTNFGVGVTNNYQGLMQDYYGFGSRNNLSLSNGVLVEYISWSLSDYSGTALSSTALPTTAPVLSDWDYSELNMWGGRRDTTLLRKDIYYKGGCNLGCIGPRTGDNLITCDGNADTQSQKIQKEIENLFNKNLYAGRKIWHQENRFRFLQSFFFLSAISAWLLCAHG